VTDLVSDGRLSVWSNDVDKVVAFDEKDAAEILLHEMGELGYEDEMVWERLPDDRFFTIWEEVGFERCNCRQIIKAANDKREQLSEMLCKLPVVASAELRQALPKPPRTLPNGHLDQCPIGSQRRTCAEWVKLNGRGYLCSSEW
jgi:hypothetical protein